VENQATNIKWGYAMDTRKIAIEYRLAHWSEVMRERAESGLTIKAFCETAGFHENIYYYWQRKLRETACKGLLPGRVKSPGTSAVPDGWSVCEVSATPTDAAGTIKIEIGKCCINVAANTELSHLTSVCRALLTLC
jgi:hypothetical protein